jgi:hypothetical protein
VLGDETAGGVVEAVAAQAGGGELAVGHDGRLAGFGQDVMATDLVVAKRHTFYHYGGNDGAGHGERGDDQPAGCGWFD